MIKKYSKLLIICILSLILISCWDYEDIDKKCIAISIGVDAVDDNIEFSGEIAQFATSAEEAKSQLSNVYKVLAYGKNFEEARINLEATNPFPTFLGATRVVVLGQNYAKQGIEAYLHRIDHIYTYRKTILPVISRERPKELFKVKVEKNIAVGFLIEDILNHLESSGRALYPTVGELISDIEADSNCYVIPYIGIEKGYIKYLGLAVMKQSKLVGVIDLEDTNGALYILSKKPVIIQTVNNDQREKNLLSFRTSIKKRKIQTKYKEKKVIIDIDLDLKAELRYQYYTEKIDDKDMKKLEKSISENVKKQIIKTIERAQNEFECDYFNFGKYFKAQYPKIYEQIEWEDSFIKADIDVSVKTKIVNKSLSDPNATKKY